MQPDVDSDGIRLVEPTPEVPGVLWAMKYGLIHVRRVSREDAHIILEPLGLKMDTDAYNDAFGALSFGNPWGYLQKFVEAGGDLKRLNITQKK